MVASTAFPPSFIICSIVSVTRACELLQTARLLRTTGFGPIFPNDTSVKIFPSTDGASL